MGTEEKTGISKSTKVIIGAIAVVFVMFAVVIAKYKYDIKKYEAIVADLQTVTLQKEDGPKIDLALIKSELKDIGELATVEYLYTDAGRFEDPKKLFGTNIPFTTKSFILKWNGVIKAGIDITRIIPSIDDTAKEIIIHMPEPTILSHNIDDETVEVLNEKDGLFNHVTIEDIIEFNMSSKEDMERRAIDNGLLIKASDNAKSIIEKIVYNDVVKEAGYTVKFETIK